MEITIKHIGIHINKGDESDVTNTYRVIDNGNEFIITCRTHRHGGNLGLAGQKGILYTDHDSNTVCRQVLDIGRDCGLKIESDEPVEGLSPWSIRGVILADRNKETREITLTAGRPESGSDQPVMLIEGQITDMHQDL
ncbi:MAG: hypothetical protein NTX75_13605 [Proteobacteria bacterium]|nr:hypothetical protein [Pseudomonadota bacterium]